MNPVILAIQNAINGTGVPDLLSKLIFPIEGLSQEPDFYEDWKKAVRNIVAYFQDGQNDLDSIRGLQEVVSSTISQLESYNREELSDTIEKLKEVSQNIENSPESLKGCTEDELF